MSFFNTPGLALCFSIVGSSIIFSVAGACLLRRRVHHMTLKEDHEVVGFVYSMIGVVYAVLLAFVVIIIWQQYNETKNAVQHEGARISNLLRDSRAFHPNKRKEIQTLILAYGKAVVDDEWAAMSTGEASPAASSAYENIWEAFYALQPETENEKAFYTESIRRLNELGNLRRARLLNSRSGLPSLLWVLLIGGGVVSVGFTYMFGATHWWTQVLTVGCLGGLTGFILFLILALDFPFAGSLRISPEPISNVVQMWEPRVGN